MANSQYQYELKNVPTNPVYQRSIATCITMHQPHQKIPIHDFFQNF